jgi:predicted DNA-binding protein with PD1-like motif
MQSKLLHEVGGQRTFAVILATGDEVLSILQEFVQRENIHAATLTAIGALSAAVLNYFNWEKRVRENSGQRTGRGRFAYRRRSR